MNEIGSITYVIIIGFHLCIYLHIYNNLHKEGQGKVCVFGVQLNRISLIFSYGHVKFSKKVLEILLRYDDEQVLVNN